VLSEQAAAHIDGDRRLAVIGTINRGLCRRSGKRTQRGWPPYLGRVVRA